MAQTLGNLMTTVRDILQDTRTTGQRHEEAKLYRYLNLALAEARRLRPDFFLPSVSTNQTTYTSADSAEDFPLDFGYEPSVISYICGMVSLEEDEYVSEGRAAALLQRFSHQLVGSEGYRGRITG